MLRRIKVFVVDDSMFFRKLLIDRLSAYPQIEIVGYAVDAFDARDKIPKIAPEVVLMDVEMPDMNGIDFLKQLLPKYPVPVLLISSTKIDVFEALSAGAVDFVKKPDMKSDRTIPLFFAELLTKIVVASQAKVKKSPPKPAPQRIPVLDTLRAQSVIPSMNHVQVIAIGASTGGTEATLSILKTLPATTPAILVVQHMPAGFTKMYAERMNNLCAMEIKEAADGDRVQRGRVLIAPGEFQMQIVRSGSGYAVTCRRGEKVSGHCPSVDVLFHSVAEQVKDASLGIILTGMGKDGAQGLLAMRKAGAFTIGQDKDSCVVYGMPMVAQEIGAVAQQAPLEEIPYVLKKALHMEY